MAKIFNGRYTAKTDQPFVVFLIGMRINQWWRFDKLDSRRVRYDADVDHTLRAPRKRIFTCRIFLEL